MHFFTLVLFTPEERRMYDEPLYAAIRERIWRYSLNLEVPEYRPACGCMGYGEGRDSARMISFLLRATPDLKPDFWQDLGLGLPAPAPTCRKCGGTGREREPLTMNPETKYDYYTVWSYQAWLDDNPDFDINAPGTEFGTVSGILECMKLRGRDGPMPTAIVTPNTLWFEWHPDEAEGTWEGQVADLLKQHHDDFAVVLNCHR